MLTAYGKLSMPPHILVLFNEPILPADHSDAESEHEVVLVSEIVAGSLAKCGFEVSRLGVSDDLAPLLKSLRDRRPDAIFNLFEGQPGKNASEACVASLLEWQDVPFTGSPAQAIHLARNKPLTKILLQGAGLPTPDFELVERLPLESRPRRWPLFVKPGLEEGSVGITQASVVERQEQLAERVAYLLETFGPPVLVESYIPGREFNVTVVEIPAHNGDGGVRLQVMPLCEIRFSEAEKSSWPIMTYDAKWRPETAAYQSTPRHFPTDVPWKLAEELRDLAERAFRLLGCRDYARVDFRVSPAGKPYIIEVNPNPCINPDAGLPAAVAAGGLTYDQFVVQLARAALARGKVRMKTAPEDVACQESIA
jgi:D-alanine-D-alanine ligase